MPFSTLMRRIISILFHLLVLIVPFIFTWSNEELFEFPKMLMVYAFTAIIAACWLMRMVAEKKWLVQRTVFDIPLITFLVSQLLSTVFSIDPHTSVFGYYTRFHGGLLSTISYTVLYFAFVSNVEKKQLKAFLKTLLFGGLGSALYAIPEHFGQSPSCYLISGKGGVGCWVQDVQTRVFGTFGQPNWLAAYAITLLPLSMVLAIQSKKTLSALVINWAIAPALLLALLFTRSRSGVAGFGISMIVFGVGYLLLALQRHGLQTSAWLHSTQTKRLLTMAGLLVGLLGWFGSPYTPSLLARLKNPSPSPSPTTVLSSPTSSTTPAATSSSSEPSAPSATPVVNRLEEGGTDSGEIRKIVWEGTIDVWRRYPILGSGVETFAYSYYQDRPTAHNLVSEWDFLYNKAHNEFLNFLATTGILGLSTYVGLLGWFAVQVVVMMLDQSQRYAHHEKEVALALLAGVIALSISNFFGFSTVMVSVLLFMFMAILAVRIHRPEHDTAHHSKLSTSQLTINGVLIITCLYLLTKVWQMWAADHEYYLGKSYAEAGYVIKGIEYLQKAVDLKPNEALYHDALAVHYAQLAAFYGEQQEPAQAAQYALRALQETDQVLELNSRHLNFYKTRVRVFITLAALDPSFVNRAKQTLEEALKLAPTDAKLMYNLGALELELKQVDQAVATLEKTVSMKPNYEGARVLLARLYEEQGDPTKALEQYQYIYNHITPDNQLVNEKLKTGQTPQ